MSRLYFKSVTFLMLLVLASVTASAQDSTVLNGGTGEPPTANKLLDWHEVFTYEVHYSFFKLGEVRVEALTDTLYNGKKSWQLQTIITSNSGIPFVGKEENHYSSIFSIKDNTVQVQKFWTDNVDEEEYGNSEYTFDRENSKVYMYEKDQPRDTLALEEPASSGHILFFISRLEAGTNTADKLPIYLNREKEYLNITYTNQTEMREYDAFPDEVKTYYTWGQTKLDGPFGFSGEFKAWFLADDLRVPVEARVKVWLGNAKIKLVDYKKERR